MEFSVKTQTLIIGTTFLAVPILIPQTASLSFSTYLLLTIPLSYLPPNPDLDHLDLILDLVVLALHMPMLAILEGLKRSNDPDLSMKLAFVIKRFVISAFIVGYVNIVHHSNLMATSVVLLAVLFTLIFNELKSRFVDNPKRLQRVKKIMLDLFQKSWSTLGRKSLSPGSSDIDTPTLFQCCICFLDCTDNYALINCGHHQLCYDCISRLKLCPLCRQPVMGFIKLYNSN